MILMNDLFLILHSNIYNLHVQDYSLFWYKSTEFNNRKQRFYKIPLMSNFFNGVYIKLCSKFSSSTLLFLSNFMIKN